jgi:hypothetical protein
MTVCSSDNLDHLCDTLSRSSVLVACCLFLFNLKNQTEQTPWLLVRKWTIPTNRPPPQVKLVPTLQVEGVAWSAQRIPTAVNLGFLDRSRYFFFQVDLQLSPRGWVYPIPDPLFFRSAGNRTRNLWICSQEHWPPDHRGGPFFSFSWHKSFSVQLWYPYKPSDACRQTRLKIKVGVTFLGTKFHINPSPQISVTFVDRQ